VLNVDWLKSLPESLILGVLGIAAMIVLLVPITLKLAGLSSQQIVDVLTLTMQFCVNLIREFRAQNKTST